MVPKTKNKLNNVLQKVLILTYYWPPSGGAGVQRWAKFSQYLKDYGYDPVVVTVDPEKASYALRDDSLVDEVSQIEVVKTNTFEPFQLYKKLLGKKEIPYAGFANEARPGVLEKMSRFVRGNLFVPDARKGWNQFALPVARRLIKKYNIKNLITSSPPHSTQLMGLKLKSEFDLNWVADLRDPWTDIYYYPLLYHTRWAAVKDKKWEKKVLQQADRVVVVSESIKALYAAKIPESGEKKIRVIPNGYDEKDFSGIKRKQNAVFTITYTGTVAGNYHLDEFFHVIAGLTESALHVRFVGRVSPEYISLIRSLKLEDKIIFIPHVHHAEAIRYMTSSDVLLLVIPDVPDNAGILTGKLFEYLASGVPVLGIGPEQGDAAAILRKCRAGVMFDYGDRKAMKSFLEEKIKIFASGREDDYQPGRCPQYARQSLTGEMARLFR